MDEKCIKKIYAVKESGENIMLRECNLDDISDGKKYLISDMVRADCNGCDGCSACCHDMGSSIVLDPLDFYRISKYLKLRFEVLLEDKIELNIVDGIILPNLKMDSKVGKPCVFLDESGRCSIHSSRPGICRIFPLGRLYENNSFSYILQIKECKKENRSKIKVSKWIDTDELELNQKFVSDWHYFLRDIHDKLIDVGDEGYIKKITLQILQCFYVEPYSEESDFYEQFYKRMEQIKRFIFEK